MNNSNDEQDKDVQEDIRHIRNDIERIKGDTHNINRIMTLANLSTIITDLKNIIGRSEIRVAILHLTKVKISAQELANKLGIDRRNLPKFIDPLTENKSYISELKEGRTMYYLRSEIIDLMNFEQQELFAPLLESWKAKQLQNPTSPPASVDRTTGQERSENNPQPEEGTG